MPLVSIGFFTNSHHYNNANIANFILAVGAASLEEEGGLRRWGKRLWLGGMCRGCVAGPSEGNWTNEICNLEM